MVFFKKISCISLTIILLVSMLINGTLSASADTEVLYSWADNVSIGTFGYDEDIDKNYLSLQDTYVGKAAFSISDTAITSGKIYISLSYRRPDSAAGNAFVRILDSTGAAFHLARLGNNLGLCADMSSSPSVTVGDFTDAKWHVLGLIFDLDNNTLTAYADGAVSSEVMQLPEAMDGIKQMGIALNSTAYSGDVTDFLVKKVVGESSLTAEGRLEDDVIIGTFNEAIGSVITVDDVSL